MRKHLWILLLVMPIHAQSAGDATDLLQRAKAFAESTLNWQAEVIQTFQVSGPNMNLKKDEVRTKVASEAPKKMIRQNSGDDRTIKVCDGDHMFYSGDGLTYEKYSYGCDLPLIEFYEPSLNRLGSLLIVGEDHVHLTDGDRRCVVIRSVLKQATMTAVRTMCIDPVRPVILRDVFEWEDSKTGIRSATTTTFIRFETNPTFPPDTFQFSIPPGAIESKPPN